MYKLFGFHINPSAFDIWMVSNKLKRQQQAAPAATWLIVGMLRQLRPLGILEVAIVEPDLSNHEYGRI